MAAKFDTCFFERYAKCSLSTLLGSRYSHLVNQDRPDLQDVQQSIGIEVTRAMREDKVSAQAMVNAMANAPIFQTDSKMCAIDRYGYAYGINDTDEMGRQEYQYWLMAMPLKRILENKVHKVTDGFYGHFSEFGLYIFTRYALTHREIEDSLHYVCALQQGSSCRYQTLYLSEITCLHVCDLTLGTFRSLPISGAQCRMFYRSALELPDHEVNLHVAQKNVSL